MSQIAIVYGGVDLYDLGLEPEADGEHLLLDQTLQTAILISLLTDRRVDPAEAPDPSDLGGYWGDSYPDVPGDQVGSRLWTLKGAKREQNTLGRAEGYVREALQWMAEDGVVSSQRDIEVALEFDGPALKGQITLAKPDNPLERWILPWSYTLG